MHQFIDIHTHNITTPANSLRIMNLYERFDRIPDTDWYSAGLHPWNLTEKFEIEALSLAVARPNVLAIGECGLDKVCTTDWNLQRTAFVQQIHLANDIGKPIIIHCVRAWDEVLTTLRQEKVCVPVVFHGFNKSNMAPRLIDQGYYLSFGKALLTSGSPAAQAISAIPADRYFLETDDADIAIADIYTAAASLLQTEQFDVILQLQQNFKTVFNR